MNWNPFRQRGETLRERRNDELERQIREALSASKPSAPADFRDRESFVRRIKAVLAA